MRSLGVGADNDRRIIQPGQGVRQGRLDRPQLRVGQRVIVDIYIANRVQGDINRLRPGFGGLAGGRGQSDIDLGVVLEGGGDHKKDQQQKHHIDQRRDIQIDLGPPSRAEIHGPVCSGRPAAPFARSPCMASTSFSASCSMVMIKSSTLPRK